MFSQQRRADRLAIRRCWPAHTLGAAAALAACALALPLASCSAHSKPGLGQGMGRAWNATVLGHAHFDEEFEIPTPGLTDLEIDTFAGNVRVTRSRPDTPATMHVTRRATHGVGRADDAADSISQIKVEYSVEMAGPRQTLVVRATTDHPEPWFQGVDIEIRVPRIGAVVVRTKDGHVEVMDFEEGVDIETTKGDVRVSTREPLCQPSTILNRDGTIVWRVAPWSRLELDAEAVHGSVRTKIHKGRWTSARKGNDGDSLRAQLNDGTARVVLRTVDGNISVYVGEHPTEYGTFVR